MSNLIDRIVTVDVETARKQDRIGFAVLLAISIIGIVSLVCFAVYSMVSKL